MTVDPNYIPTLTGAKHTERQFNFYPFMTPHMFTPEYLEVDYTTCSTVLLRSPLPQPERLEIPSPHPPLLHQLVFEWYASIKRRKTKVVNFESVRLNGISIRLKPKFSSIFCQDQEKHMLRRKGIPYVSRKAPFVARRRVVRFRYTPKRDRYTLKYG